MGDGEKEGDVEVSESELLPEELCRYLEKESRRKAVLKVCEYKGEEAGGADPLVEKRCVEVRTVFSGGHGFAKQETGESKVDEERNEFVGFASTEGESDKKDAKIDLFEMR